MIRTSAARPTMGARAGASAVSRAGGSGTAPAEGTRESSPIAVSWNRRTGRSRSFSRRSPSSSSANPSSSSSSSSMSVCVAWEMRTWPPWAAAQIRAARWTARPA